VATRNPKSQKGSKPAFNIVAGDWTGEFVNAGSLTYGQMDQPGPPIHVVEFTYIVAPAIFRSPDRQDWGGVLMIMPPPRAEPLAEAGSVLGGGTLPTLTVSLNAGRVQFSDLVRQLEQNRITGLRLSIGPNNDGTWRVSSWHMSVELRDQARSPSHSRPAPAASR
jgi:hypothetical protein